MSKIAKTKFNIGHTITIGIVVVTALCSSLITWGANQQEQASQNEAIAGKADKEVVEVQFKAIQDDLAWIKQYLVKGTSE